jgi:hypothetical protein
MQAAMSADRKLLRRITKAIKGGLYGLLYQRPSGTAILTVKHGQDARATTI